MSSQRTIDIPLQTPIPVSALMELFNSTPADSAAIVDNLDIDWDATPPPWEHVEHAPVTPPAACTMPSAAMFVEAFRSYTESGMFDTRHIRDEQTPQRSLSLSSLREVTGRS